MTRNTIIDLYKNKDDLQNYKGTVFGMVSAVSDSSPMLPLSVVMELLQLIIYSLTIWKGID